MLIKTEAFFEALKSINHEYDETLRVNAKIKEGKQEMKQLLRDRFLTLSCLGQKPKAVKAPSRNEPGLSRHATVGAIPASSSLAQEQLE